MLSPFGDDPVNNTSAWRPEPNGRGTWGILSSCILTILLCVWSAVHLNVPQHRKTWAQYVRKLKWLLIALFAPELVVYVAWQQRNEASRLLEDIRGHLGTKSPRPKDSAFRRKLQRWFSSSDDQEVKTDRTPVSPVDAGTTLDAPWTLVHGFYAAMGGFAISTAHPSGSFLPSPYTRAAITPEGIRFLLSHEPDALPYLTEAQIRDKSKADGLKKTIVCAQALWFCIQCFTRLAQSLPVSLLEVNTFAHSLCTLLIYVLWWDKPLDVEEPAEVKDPRLFPIFAYMWMTSRISAQDYAGHDIGGQLRDEFDCIWPFENPVAGDLLLQTRTPEASNPANFPSADEQPAHLSAKGFAEISVPGKLLVPGRNDYNWRRYPSYKHRIQLACAHKVNALYNDKNSKMPTTVDTLLRSLFNHPAGLFVRKTAIDHFSPNDLLRWRLAHSAIGRYALELDLRVRHATPANGLHLRSRVALRQPNIVYTHQQPLHMAAAVATSAALYGGLHLVAWNAAFPSPVEQLLWRISASCVTGNGMLIGLIAHISYSPAARKRCPRCRDYGICC